jgi:hypothetical protein
MKKTSYLIIFCIMLCNFFTSIGMMFVETHDGTWQCWTQAIITNIFPVACVFWTSQLAGLVYCAV